MLDKRLYPSGALHGQVAHDIGRRIVSGSIAEGETLPREAELSQQFSVSRQAVREALKVLAAKGLVKSRRRAGTQVLPRSSWNLLDPDILAWHASDTLPPGFLDDLVEIRRLIEPAAAAYAASRGEPLKLAHIADALDSMRAAANDVERLYAADVAFHLAVFAASGNTLIDYLSTILAPLLEASFRLQHGAGHVPPELVLSMHQSVYDAIKGGDSVTARTAMESLLDSAVDQIVQATRG